MAYVEKAYYNIVYNIKLIFGIGILQFSDWIMEIMKKSVLNVKIKLGKILIILVLMMASLGAIGQEKISVKGKVTDETGMGLPGGTVMEKGTSNGTITDADGNFKLNIAPDAKLVVSFIGFQPQEIVVGNQTFLDIQLATDIQSLSEVVVVGYGEQTKETLTGAVEQVTSETFADRAVTSPAEALQGQSPGLIVTRSSPRPQGRSGNGVGFNIRGATSVNGGSPLIVIDGVPVADAREFYQTNPDDIESISILKDGAASIFGSRAANGVIVVTTKRGEGKVKVDYTGNVRMNTIGIRPPTPTMQEYATLWLEAGEEDAPNTTYWGWGSKSNLERMQQGLDGIYPTPLWGDIYIGNHDRFDQLFGTSYSHQHNLSVSGSSEKSKYRISGMFADNQTALTVAEDGQKQYNIRFNYDYDITDRLSLRSSVTYQRSITSSPSSGFGRGMGSWDPPFFPAKNPDGEWYANFNIGGRNSVAAMVDGGRVEYVEDLTKINLEGKYQITDHLDLSATMSYNRRFTRNDLHRVTVELYQWESGETSPQAINALPLVEVRTSERTYQNYGSYLNYKRTFGKHMVSAMAGITSDLQDDKSLVASRTNISNQGVYDLNVAPANNMTNSGGSSQWGLYSYLSRLNYDYDGKYLIELIGRRDGSSRFDSDFRWSNYGSVNGGWVITEESFMKNVSLISFLKIRGSYGEMGNFVGIGRYDYLSTIDNGTALFGATPSYQTTARVADIVSRTRTWERIKMTNFGVDFSLFDYRLSGAFDYYVKRNTGMLIDVIYPDVLGGRAPKSNNGLLETKGWEAQLGWKDVIGEMEYNFSFNLSDARNELIEFSGTPLFELGRNGPIQGYPLNSYFLYQTDGFFANQQEVDAYYDAYTQQEIGLIPVRDEAADPDQLAVSELRPGDTRKIDVNGDGIINTDDIAFMGDADPHYTFGINMGARWKGFDFNAMLQGVLNQNILRLGYFRYPFNRVWSNQTPAFLGQTWTEERPDAEFPRMTANQDRASWNWEDNDFMLLNNRYIRLKALIVGYTLPKELFGKINVDRLRVYFSGNDLFEFTSVKDGFDPEFGESSQTIYPWTRTWSLGVNITL